MMTGTKIYTLLLISLISVIGFGQETVESVIQKAAATYTDEVYGSYYSDYKLYADYTTKVPYESYRGTVVKKNGVSYTKIKDTELVSFKEYNLKVNHQEKAMVIEKNPSNKNNNQATILDYLHEFKGELTEESQYYIITFEPKAITQIMLSKIEIKISKKDYSVKEQTLYYVEYMQYENEKGQTESTQPRMIISYKPRLKNIKQDNQLVQSQRYFSKNGEKIQLSAALSGYELFQY